MTKKEFLLELRKGLTGLPQDDLENRLLFYSEMIDDRVEDGLTEEQAVAEIGDVKDVVSQTIAEIPFAKLVKERIKIKRPMGWLGVLLIVLGSPIWLSLLIAFLAVLFSLLVAVFAVVFSVAISFWAIPLSLAASALACALGSVFLVFQNGALGLFVFGGALLCAGLAVLFYLACIKLTKVFCWLSKWVWIGVKRCFIRKKQN